MKFKNWIGFCLGVLLAVIASMFIAKMGEGEDASVKPEWYAAKVTVYTLTLGYHRDFAGIYYPFVRQDEFESFDSLLAKLKFLINDKEIKITELRVSEKLTTKFYCSNGTIKAED